MALETDTAPAASGPLRLTGTGTTKQQTPAASPTRLRPLPQRPKTNYNTCSKHIYAPSVAHIKPRSFISLCLVCLGRAMAGCTREVGGSNKKSRRQELPRAFDSAAALASAVVSK